VAALASSLPDGDRYKVWLLLLAPSVSLAVTAIWLWAQVEIANYMQDRKIRSVAKNIRTTLQASLANPNTSEEHRLVIRKKLEEIDLIIADRELSRIRSLVPVTFSDVRKTHSETATHK
jgi:hypothetical protein